MAEKVQLLHEIDFSRSVSGARQMEGTLTKAHRQIDQAVKTTATNVARAAPAITGAMSAMTAGTLASQQAWTSLAGVVAGSFAAGGVVGGAIALLGAGIGALAKTGKQEISEFEKRIRSLNVDNRQLSEDIAKAERELRAARGIDEQAESLKKLNVQVVEARTKLKEFRAEVDKANRRGDGLVRDPLDPTKELFPAGAAKRVREMTSELARLVTQRDRLEKLRDILDEIADVRRGVRVGATTAALRRQLDAQRDLLGAGSDFEEFEAKLRAQVRELREVKGVGPEAIGEFEDVARRGFFSRQIDSLAAMTDAADAQARALRVLDPIERERLAIIEQTAQAMQRAVVPDSAPDDVKAEAARLRASLEELQDARLGALDVRERESLQITQFTRTLGSQISNAFADATIQGFRRGFAGAKDVGRSFLDALLSQILNFGSAAALHAIAPSLFPSGVKFFQHGGLVDRPTLAVLGEAGPEHVQPLGSPSFAQQLAQALVSAGAGGGGDLRLFFEPGQAFAAGARGNVPMLQAAMSSAVVRPTTRAMALAQRRRRF